MATIPNPATTEWVPLWDLEGDIIDPHRLTHEPGGTDEIVNINANNLTSGTVNDARLSGNVALENLDNSFTQGQHITTAYPFLTLTDTGQPANARVWRIEAFNQVLRFAALDDAESAYINTGLFIGRAGSVSTTGDYYEKSRSYPMGHWIDVAFSAGNFGATGGTWTVSAHSRFSYMLVGKTAFIQLIINGTSTVGGTPSSLSVVMPFTLLANQTGTFYYNLPGAVGIGTYFQQAQDGYLRLFRDPFGTAFTAGTGYLFVSVTAQIL